MNEHYEADGPGRAVGLEEVWEVPVLLSGGYFRALEEAACRRGLTTAELLRCLITIFLNHEKGQDRGGPPSRRSP